ncbi:site-specific integrase [Bradyrhizobium sp. AUGA SZCCT0177]|uniref:site-specific integrase n=1 Tax=Bradyrhizobium sp. AUGA SZCCT0177 TaxID=2807665 RepID=UPI001BAA3A75|nr:site-specific integrase [Bradyrhizobium sp. AUGA SZCCT0177]MBR1285404.1 site-specific integrase [Bradyrhizobium sp. AUGA SZCCT0177]
MGLIKNEHGVFHVRRKVPKALEGATARVMGAAKERVSWLKKSLATKDAKQAKVLAAPVMMKFNRVLAQAAALLVEHPVRTGLTEAEVRSMADYHFAAVLAEDDRQRRAGLQPFTPEDQETLERFGMDARSEHDLAIMEIADNAEGALAATELEYIKEEVEELLDIFQLRLDERSDDYRKLSLAVLREHVRAYRALRGRSRGEPVETPSLPPTASRTPSGGLLSAAYEGWKKAKNAAGRTADEFERAVALFIQLHGDLPVATITRAHVRQFVEAMQEVPRRRSGNLLKAPLPQIALYGRNHPEVPKITAATINKNLSGVQAIAVWAWEKGGFIHDDVRWADPFAKMRLDEEDSEREPFTSADLSMIFGSPVFLKGDRPQGGRDEAAFWLPLLALFTGARLAELGQLSVDDVTALEGASPLIKFRRDSKRGKSLKSDNAARAIPIHPELQRMGFLGYVESIRRTQGDDAWLFIGTSPEAPRGSAAYSKWFGRYLRDTCNVTDTNKVFHSFRHSFKDALRAAEVPEDLGDALTGHSNQSVGRSYGAKGADAMVRRFTLPRMVAAIERVTYSGLDLTALKWIESQHKTDAE